MPREAREKSSTGIYHIIMRGINRQSIFEDEEDRQQLIERFAHYKAISCYRPFAYCLMDNHIHMLLEEQKEPIAMIIKRISSSYVLWFNRKHRRCGHLIQERFKSEIVDTDSYFLTVLRYIHQNPLKVNIVEDVSEYKWSYGGGMAYIGHRLLTKSCRYCHSITSSLMHTYCHNCGQKLWRMFNERQNGMK